MDRRTFIGAAGIFGLSAGVGGWTALRTFSEAEGAPPLEGLVLAGARAPYQSCLLTDLKNKKEFLIKTPFVFHQCLLDSERAHIFAIPRLGSVTSIFDLRTRHEVGQLKTQGQNYFYGHGVLLADGKHLLLGEALAPTGDGALSVWNLDTLKMEDRWPTHGLTPHDCQVSADGRQVYVLNSGMVPESWNDGIKDSFCKSRLDR